MKKLKKRKSRFHDEKGNLISIKNLFLHILPTILSGSSRIIFKYRPLRPWIPYSAIKELKSFLNKSKTVLEFGSGMSTLWLAGLAKSVDSVEDSPEWFEHLNRLIAEKKIKNISYKFLTANNYYTYSGLNNTMYDLIIIDGSYRSNCLRNAFQHLKPNGAIYIDDCDKDADTQDGDMRVAERLALNFARETNAFVEYYTDFAPTQFFVQQGMLIKFVK